jgi:hypothetical protein
MHHLFKPAVIRKGAQISSYLISIALITAGFKQQIDLYMLPTINTTSSPRCVSLSFGYVKISLVHSSETRCVLSSETRCVFKIYNVTRFMLQ